MAFVFDVRSKNDLRSLTATDPDTGETITRSYPSSAAGGPRGVFACRYSRPGEPPIDFVVTSRLLSDGKAQAGVAAAVVIDEQKVRQKYMRAYIGQGFASGFANGLPDQIAAGWDAFKQRVAEGVFVVSAFGGDYLKWSPDFRVEWVNTLSDERD